MTSDLCPLCGMQVVVPHPGSSEEAFGYQPVVDLDARMWHGICARALLSERLKEFPTSHSS